MMVCSRQWIVGRKDALDSGRLEAEEDAGGELRVRCDLMDCRGRRVDLALSSGAGRDLSDIWRGTQKAVGWL